MLVFANYESGDCIPYQQDVFGIEAKVDRLFSSKALELLLPHDARAVKTFFAHLLLSISDVHCSLMFFRNPIRIVFFSSHAHNLEIIDSFQHKRQNLQLISMVLYVPRRYFNLYLPVSPSACQQSRCGAYRPHAVSNNVVYSNDSATFSLDVPGVKLSDVKVYVNGETIEVQAERRGSRPFKLERRFLVRDHHNYNLFSTEAQLEDGVLNVSIPKKQDLSPIAIEATAEEPPAELGEKETSKFCFSFDLPGVNIADFHAEIHPDGSIFFKAQRKIGGRSGSIEKTLSLNQPVQHAKVFLRNGVVTFSGSFAEPLDPKKQEIEVLPSQDHSIPEATEVAAPVETKDASDEENDMVLVEDVDEAVEKE